METDGKLIDLIRIPRQDWECTAKTFHVFYSFRDQKRLLFLVLFIYWTINSLMTAYSDVQLNSTLHILDVKFGYHIIVPGYFTIQLQPVLAQINLHVPSTQHGKNEKKSRPSGANAQILSNNGR